VGVGDNVDGYDLADGSRCFGSRLRGSSDGGYVTPDQGRHQPSSRRLPTQDSHVRRLDHGIGGLDHGDIATSLYHPQCVVHVDRLTGPVTGEISCWRATPLAARQESRKQEQTSNKGLKQM